MDLSVKGVTMIGITITKPEIKPLKSARSNCHLGRVLETGNMDCGALSGRPIIAKETMVHIKLSQGMKAY